MAIKKKPTNASNNDTDEDFVKEIDAGVSDEEAKEAKKASDEVKDEEAPAFLADEDDEDDDGLAELPEDAALSNSDASLVSNVSAVANETPAHVYGDKFTGQGGSYAIDPDTGERKQVFEKYLNSKGKERFRPVR